MLLRILVLSLLVVGLPYSALAEQQADYREGRHYVTVDSPVRPRNPERIEVVEVFWYGCPHCFQFQPLIKSWLSRQGEDVDFVKKPAMWNELMEVHARAHYTAKALGIEDELDEAIFHAVNMERKPLRNERELQAFFAGHEVDGEEFRRTFNSFGVLSQARQARDDMRSYGVRGTPEMVVAGRYRVSTRLDGVRTHSDMLRVVDYLVERERGRRAE